MKLRIKRLHPDARMPERATAGAACFDLHAFEVDSFQPHANDPHAAIFRTGLAFEVPAGHVLLIFSRSGHGFLHALRLSNCVGVIDSDYRGEVKVALRFDGSPYRSLKVREGDRIAQALLIALPELELEEITELTTTDRGARGFGSTGN